MVPLGEVATIERATVDPTTLDPETPYLGLEHLERGGRITGSATVGSADLRSTKFRFDPNHVLYGKLRPNLAKVSRPHFAGVCSTDILPIRPGQNLDRGYLAHYLLLPSMTDYAATRTSGANLPRLSPTVLASFPVPLPPVYEQRRIAAILDKADEVRTKRREALAHLETLPQILLARMLQESVPAEVALGSVANFHGGASLPAGVSFDGQQSGTLLMKVSDMNAVGNENRIFATGLWTEAATRSASSVQAGAVVIPKRGASIATNKKRLTTRATALDPNLMGIQPDLRQLTPEYLLQWFNSFDLATITSGSTVPQLNKQDLAPLAIPLPDLPTQRDFAARVERIDKQRSTLERALAADDELFASLQSRAFRGEL